VEVMAVEADTSPSTSRWSIAVVAY